MGARCSWATAWRLPIRRTISGSQALVTSGTTIIDGPITLAGNATITNLGGTLILSGQINKTGVTLTMGGPGLTIVNAPIVGNNGGQFDSDYDVVGNVQINTPASYSGATNIFSGGRLSNGVNNALPSGTIVNVGSTDNSNGSYDLNGYQQTVAAINTVGSGAGSSPTRRRAARF